MLLPDELLPMTCTRRPTGDGSANVLFSWYAECISRLAGFPAQPNRPMPQPDEKAVNGCELVEAMPGTVATRHSGTVTSVCCESTAREAAMRNFKAVMITDADAGRDDEEHWARLSNILLGFGDVYATEEVIPPALW